MGVFFNCRFQSFELRNEEPELLYERLHSLLRVLFVLLLLFLLSVGDKHKRQPLHDLQKVVVEDALETLVFILPLLELLQTSCHYIV